MNAERSVLAVTFNVMNCFHHGSVFGLSKLNIKISFDSSHQMHEAGA